MYKNLLENLVYGKRTVSAIPLIGAIILVSAVYLLWNQRRKLPPGPIGLPIFGYYLFLRKNPVDKLTELAKKYGNVMGMYIGLRYVVVLSDWEAVKDGLGQNATLHRPPTLFEKIPYKFGFAGANGSEWVETRRLASKVLKDGLQKNNWEALVEEELSDMIELIKREGGNPIEVSRFFRDSFCNNIMSLIMGERLHYDDSTRKMIAKSIDFIMDNTSTLGILNFSETLALFLWMFGLERLPPFAKETSQLFKFISDTVDCKIENLNSDESDSFISRFQRVIDGRKKVKQESFITDDSLKGSLMGLMVGGTETSRTAIIWALIAMANHPDKQKKVQEELNRVIGKEGSLRWSDRSQVPYTLASLLESLRWSTLGPLPALRMVAEDTRIQGYHIPKGTFLVTNIKCIHSDPKYWKDPDQFIPERFLLEDGRKVNMAPDSFLPFSYGKRNCPGKLLALMDLLQYFSTLMKKFKVVPKEGDTVKYNGVLGLSYQPRNAELRFIPL